jgi:hypothetical protein
MILKSFFIGVRLDKGRCQQHAKFSQPGSMQIEGLSRFEYWFTLYLIVSCNIIQNTVAVVHRSHFTIKRWIYPAVTFLLVFPESCFPSILSRTLFAGCRMALKRLSFFQVYASMRKFLANSRYKTSSYSVIGNVTQHIISFQAHSCIIQRPSLKIL